MSGGIAAKPKQHFRRSIASPHIERRSREKRNFRTALNLNGIVEDNEHLNADQITYVTS